VDRERAQTFLRLLAEAELRDPLPPPRHAGGATDFPFFSVPAPVRRLLHDHGQFRANSTRNCPRS
jgi:hypothetical protein